MKNEEKKLAIETIQSAEELLQWIAKKSSKIRYQMEELKKKPEEIKELKELFDAQFDGYLASYREEFAEALEKLKTKTK